MRKTQQLIVGLSLAFVIAGCGGGSSDSQPSQNKPSQTQNNPSTQNDTNKLKVLKAYVIDNAIESLHYVSYRDANNDPLDGITNANGEFSYYEGKNTEFYVGGTKEQGGMKIGQVTSALVSGKKKVYITDLLGKPKGEYANPEVVKLAQFLQSLDTDKTKDGIQLNPKQINDLVKPMIDKNKTFSDLNLSTDMGTTPVVDANEAMSHFKQSLSTDGVSIIEPISKSGPSVGILYSKDQNVNNANIEPDQIVEVNQGDKTAIFRADAVAQDGKEIKSYEWKVDGKSVQKGEEATSFNFGNLEVGEHQVTLIVTDNKNVTTELTLLHVKILQAVVKSDVTVSYEPASTDLIFDSNITLNFSAPIDEESAKKVKLTHRETDYKVPVEVTITTTPTSLTIDPKANLKINDGYRVETEGILKDKSGKEIITKNKFYRIANKPSTDTNATNEPSDVYKSTTVPYFLETDVPVNDKIYISFSGGSLDPNSVTADTLFLLDIQGGNIKPSYTPTFANDNQTVYLVMNEPLKYSTMYRFEWNGLKDSLGKTIPQGYISFTTMAKPADTNTSSDANASSDTNTSSDTNSSDNSGSDTNASGDTNSSTEADTQVSNATLGQLRTGQIKSYDADAQEVTNDSVHDDGYYARSGIGVERKFKVNASEKTILDLATGLTWEDDGAKIKGEGITYEKATEHCTSLGEGWRLPTYLEARTLINYGSDNHKIMVFNEFLTNIDEATASKAIWTSTNVGADENQKISFIFKQDDSSKTYYKIATTSNAQTRCVKK